MKVQFTEGHIVGFLLEADAGVTSPYQRIPRLAR